MREKKMNKYLFISITLIFVFDLFINCKTSTEPVTGGVSINKEIVADYLGDHNGITTETELETLNQYFSKNDKAWVVGSGFNRLENEIHSDTLIKYFSIQSPLFKSKTELKDHYKNKNIRTPFVGIYVMESNRQIIFRKIFRAPGPNIYSSVWQEVQIK